MTPSPADGTRTVPLTPAGAEALAATLVREMVEEWRGGRRPLPEEYLARHPALRGHPEAAADLIYEELCLRQEHGAEVPAEQVLGRFPEWRPQLEVLFECQRLLDRRPAAPRFPAAGESLGDFLLLAEIGRGGQGRVFLASQLSLADRPVALKLTPCEADEHLSLARLQHSHIVPLYSVQDHPARGLRALCMPYFGGATLARLLDALRPVPPARRTARQLLDALAAAQAVPPLVAPARRQPPAALSGATYVGAVCWVGACLAEGLHYAHERGLVHLDVKPSNVLLAADGQPMLLDFHLARGPVGPAAGGEPWVGGTPGYMSPEQRDAIRAVEQGRAVPRPVDGRSDVYSLGVLLYEALGGDRVPTGVRQPLCWRNGQVSVGLADVIARCLAEDPAGRYPNMAALAADLRRHLADLPLAGVRNRSLAERWHKWRRRRPHGVALAGMMLAVLAAAGAVALGAASHYTERVGRAAAALRDGRVQAARGAWEAAVDTFKGGLAEARGLPGQQSLADDLEGRLALAEQGRADAARAAAAAALRQLADRARFLYGLSDLPPEGARSLAGPCRACWEQRGAVAGAGPDAAVREDLLDLAIFWADLQARSAPAGERESARRRALAVLDQAEALCGPGPVLDAERALHGAPVVPTSRPPRDAWEHYALGRALLRSGDLGRAAEEVGKAVRLQPQGLWPNFYEGLCAYRQGRYEDAVTAYSVCIGAAPESAVCFHNRGLARAALGKVGPARQDHAEAERLDPTLAVAGRPRGSGEGR